MAQEKDVTSLEERRVEADIRFREAELQLRREELVAQREKDRRGIRVPLWVAALSLVGGLLVAAIQGYYNVEMGTQKFQSDLILKAIETGNVKDSEKNLRFLVRTGFLKDKGGKLATLLNSPESVPVLPAPASSQVQLVQPGVVDVSRDDKVEFFCDDPANPEAVVTIGVDEESIHTGAFKEGSLPSLPSLSPGVHSLWWLTSTPSSTLSCEVTVNGTVQYKKEISSAGFNNGSVLLRVR